MYLFDMPVLASLQTISVNPDAPGSAFVLPDSLTADMKAAADKEEATALFKNAATIMLNEASTTIIAQLQEAASDGILCINEATDELGCAVTELEGINTEDQCVCILVASARMDEAKQSLVRISGWYQALHDAIGKSYETAAATYLDEIDNRSAQIGWMYASQQREDAFPLFILLTALSAAVLAGLLIYDQKRKRKIGN